MAAAVRRARKRERLLLIAMPRMAKRLGALEATGSGEAASNRHTNKEKVRMSNSQLVLGFECDIEEERV